MTGVKRYDLMGVYDLYIGDANDGDYVTHDDYEKLQSDLAEARENFVALQVAKEIVEAENAALRGSILKGGDDE